MKANEAPEKIYIQSFNVSEEDAKFTRKLYFDDVWTEEPESGQENIEYIRTEAFIEKAAGWLSDNTLSGLCLDLGNAEIVREFVDNFKNFMKQ